jgi:dTMP kinase
LHPDIRSYETDRSGNLVILERWAGAIVAYGRAAGTSEQILAALEMALTTALPHCKSFLIDVPGVVAADRLRATNDPNKFETRGHEYLDQVGREYRRWASDRNVRVIDGSARSAMEQAELILDILDE